MYSSQVLNELADIIHQKLSIHPINHERIAQGQPPANIVLLRGPGKRITVKSFFDTHQMKGFMIAPTCIIAGLGLSLGMDVLRVPGATGDYGTDLSAKAMAAVKALASPKGYDFGFIHVKAVDDASHDRNLAKKIEFLEKIDTMITLLVHELSKLSTAERTIRLVITGDHSTPVQYGDHSFEPVPFTICSLPLTKSQATDNVHTFSEIAAAQGYLGRFPGNQVMPILRQLKSR